MKDKRVVKSEIITVMSHELDLSKNEVKMVVDCFLEQITSNLLNGNRIVLRNFGRFDT